MKISEFEQEIYKDSGNILGMSISELEDFMNPNITSNSSQGVNKATSAAYKEDMQFMQRLERAVEIPESLNQDLEHIGNYCLKLIQQMQSFNGKTSGVM